MRLSTYDKPRVIGCGDDLPQHIALPRGSLADALELLQHHSVKATILDEHVLPERLSVSSFGEYFGSIRQKPLNR